jgi:hypothetical protein
MNSLEVGITLKALLLKNTTIKKFANNNIFPVIAESDVSNFIVYSRSINPRHVKYGTAGDDIDLEITICSSDYATGVKIAQEVRNTLDNINIDNSCWSLTYSSESYGDELYR